MGEGELVKTERPFHIMNAVDRTSAKLSTCTASCRGCMEEREESILVGWRRIGWREVDGS